MTPIYNNSTVVVDYENANLIEPPEILSPVYVSKDQSDKDL